MNPDVTMRTAVAFAAEGDITAAESLLMATLEAHPDWLDGHRCLATMRWAAGRGSEFVQSYRDACRVQPRNPALRMAWFSMLALIRDWPAAAQVLDEAAAMAADERLLAPGRLYIACETGATAEAERAAAADRRGSRSWPRGVPDPAFSAHRPTLESRNRRRPPLSDAGRPTRMALSITDLAPAERSRARSGSMEIRRMCGPSIWISLRRNWMSSQACCGGCTAPRTRRISNNPCVVARRPTGPCSFGMNQFCRRRARNFTTRFSNTLPACLPLSRTSAARCPRQPIQFSGSWSVRTECAGISHQPHASERLDQFGVLRRAARSRANGRASGGMDHLRSAAAGTRAGAECLRSR